VVSLVEVRTGIRARAGIAGESNLLERAVYSAGLECRWLLVVRARTKEKAEQSALSPNSYLFENRRVLLSSFVCIGSMGNEQSDEELWNRITPLIYPVSNPAPSLPFDRDLLWPTCSSSGIGNIVEDDANPGTGIGADIGPSPGVAAGDCIGANSYSYPAPSCPSPSKYLSESSHSSNETGEI